MAEINWGLLGNAPDPGQSFAQGFERGQALRQERGTKAALQAYINDPTDPRAVGALAQYNPALAMKVQADQTERIKAARVSALQQKAASGDPASLAQLAGIDLDAWAKIDTRTKAQVKERVDYIGQAALAVSQLPEAQRPQAWDQYIDQAVQNGHPELADYKGKYSPQALQGAIASAGQMKAFLDTQKIEWHQQGERPSFATYGSTGQLVDPQAVTGAGVISAGPGADMPTVSSPDEARRLPPGTRFKTPDGRIKVVPGGATASPSPTFP